MEKQLDVVLKTWSQETNCLVKILHLLTWVSGLTSLCLGCLACEMALIQRVCEAQRTLRTMPAWLMVSPEKMLTLWFSVSLQMPVEFMPIWITGKVIVCFWVFALIQILVQLPYFSINSTTDFLPSPECGITEDESDPAVTLGAFTWATWSRP